MLSSGIIPRTLIDLVNGKNSTLIEFLKLSLQNDFLCWQVNQI